MFDTQTLITISGLSRRTFYRYMSTLKNQGLLIVGNKKHFYEEAEAKTIAEKLGFKNKFDNYIVLQNVKSQRK